MPPRRHRNIAGLKNQHPTLAEIVPGQSTPGSVELVEPEEKDLHVPRHMTLPANSEELDKDWCPGTAFDSMKIIVNEDGGEMDSEAEELVDSEWDDLNDEEFCENLYDMAMREGDYLTDEDWLPSELKRKKCKKNESKTMITLFHNQRLITII
jgi:hypothetical protein